MSPLAGSELAFTRSRLGVTTLGGNPHEIADAKRDHAAALIAAHIQRIVAAAPPLTSEQRDRIAALLRPAGGDSR